MSVDSIGVPETSPEPQAANEPVVADGASAAQATSSEPDSKTSASTADRPLRRIKIGSEREGAAVIAKANPVTPGTPSATAKPAPTRREPKHYPPPNVRDQLSPELEAEYAAALGELSLENLLSEEAGGGPLPELAPESRVIGKVAKIHREDVFVDLANRNQGIVPMRQFEEPPEVGAEIELVVVRFNAEEGLYELSRPTAAVTVGNWEDVREGQIIEVTITGSNKGGLECQVSGVRGFIPMGQLSIYRVENPEEYVGQRLSCVVTEANRDRQNLVLSHRAVMERERLELREKLLEKLAVGQIHEGIVRSMKDFGAFVDLGGVDGLVHVSQLSWDRVKHPSEVLEVGQKIKVRVEKFDKETGKVSLSYRELGDNPWDKVQSKYYVGARVHGIVSRLMEFGAFVKLEPGVEGLVHISELAHNRIWRTSDAVSEGQEVEVKVLSVDTEKQRISLSLKALSERPKKPGEEKVADEDLAPPPDAPKAPRKRTEPLKGGIGGPSGGDKFGLNW
ncbi:MAG TPA: S1 RNA-binding domain-containing protein [Lacipirellulaceae bacterium]|jgi:small subunit ribosomal protein S1